MKNEKTLRKEQLVKDLYWIEKKNKHNRVWDNNVKIAFEVSSSYSFEELVIKNTPAAEQLVVLFKQDVENQYIIRIFQHIKKI